MKKITVAGILLVSLLSLCGCGTSTVYESNELNATLTKTEEGKELSLRVSVTPTALPDALAEHVKDLPVTNYFEVRLSDENNYVYSDDTLDGGGMIYAESFATEAELEAATGLAVLSSPLTVYPEEEQNYVLYYDPEEGSVSVSFAKSALSETLIVQENIYMNCGGATETYMTTLTGVSNSIDCEAVQTPAGENAIMFTDESADLAGVCLMRPDTVYWWSFEGDVSEEAVTSFVDSLAE